MTHPDTPTPEATGTPAASLPVTVWAPDAEAVTAVLPGRDDARIALEPGADGTWTFALPP